MMYSVPVRYSWATAQSLRSEKTFSCPISFWNARTDSAGLSQKWTPSLPALRGGLTTIRPPTCLCQRSSSSADVTRNWRAAGTPAARTASVIANLSRRAALSAVPFVARPRPSLSASASSTPLSPPATTATG
jgi:hypothetical protein